MLNSLKFTWHPYYGPETGDVGGGSGGGSTENTAGTSGAAEAAVGVTSGSASDALIKAAMASESSTEEISTGSEAEAVARATGQVEDTTQTGTHGPGATQKPATTAQAATGQPPTGAKGPIPFDRHEAALKNARTEAAAEALKPLAWAKDLKQQDVAVAFDVASQIIAGPEAFVRKLAQELGFEVVKPGQQPTGTAATGASSLFAADGKLALPKGKLRSEDGLEAYSSDQLAGIIEGVISHVEQKMTGSLKPLLDERTTAQQTEARNRIVSEARQTASVTLTEARKLPHFQMKDHAGQMVDHPKILANLQAIPVETRKAIGPVAALYQAYNKFLSEDVFPTLGQRSEQQVRDDNRRKAAASQGAHPAGQQVAGKKPELKGVSDLARRMEEMAAGGAV